MARAAFIQSLHANTCLPTKTIARFTYGEKSSDSSKLDIYKDYHYTRTHYENDDV